MNNSNHIDNYWTIVKDNAKLEDRLSQEQIEVLRAIFYAGVHSVLHIVINEDETAFQGLVDEYEKYCSLSGEYSRASGTMLA